MKLVEFQVSNFRSINDSGPVSVSKLTTLVGRNESGKSNLLLGLLSLSPPDGVKPLQAIKDFPRDRRLSECTDDTIVVRSLWEMSSKEEATLAELFPRAAGIKRVNVERDYKGTIYVGFVDLPPRRFSGADIAANVRKIKPVVAARAEKATDEAAKAKLLAALQAFETASAKTAIPNAWGEGVAPTIEQLRQALATIDAELTPTAEAALTELGDLAEQVPADANAHTAARNWVRDQLPVFVYLDEYPDLPGHQELQPIWIARLTIG